LGLAQELYETLLGPVEPLIKDKKHLVIAPSGVFTALPFHLLVTQKPAVAVPSFASKALYVSTTRRPASPKPISTILPGPIRFRTGRKIEPASRVSSHRYLCTQGSIAGPPGSFGRTDQPTPATFSST
jgi:hypothetical protein